MSEQYVVYNNTRGPLTFSLYQLDLDLTGMPNHHRRKAIRGGTVHVVIPMNGAVDLCEKGFSIENLKRQPELQRLLNNPVGKLRLAVPEAPFVEPVVEEAVPVPAVIEATPVETPVEEPKPVEVVIPSGLPFGLPVEESKEDVSEPKKRGRKPGHKEY